MRGGRIWVVAPSYKQALENWSYLQRLIAQLPPNLAKNHLSELTVTFTGGGSIQIRTADNPDSLRGAGLDGVVLDEAATMKREAWDLVLRPALADRQGWALFIGTPQHFNWFFELWEHGQGNKNEDWASWQHPTWDNPYIPWSEIEAAQRDMLPEDFDQEFGASFTVVGGAIFRLLGLNRPLYLRPMPLHLAQPGVFKRTGVGMDWGTTREHNANVTCGSQLPDGFVWMRSSWLDYSGSSDKWFNEAERCMRDFGASFARVDRSQSSAIDTLTNLGYQADKGLANVEERNGKMQSLVIAKAVAWDSNDPGAVQSFEHYASYHRDKDGKIVEEEDDDVDGGGYLVSGFAERHVEYLPPRAYALQYQERGPPPAGSELEQIVWRQAERARQKSAAPARRGAL